MRKVQKFHHGFKGGVGEHQQRDDDQQHRESDDKAQQDAAGLAALRGAVFTLLVEKRIAAVCQLAEGHGKNYVAYVAD